MPLIFGKNSIIEVLKFDSSKVKKIFVSIDLDQSVNKGLAKLIRETKVELQKSDRSFLDRMTSSTKHQGIVAEIEERKILKLSEYLATNQKNQELILILDQITDPHNFGAILRAAECFGVSGVLWSNVRSVSITEVVVKSAVGATELVNLIQVTNLAQAIEDLKKNNYWIVASVLEPEATPIQKFSFPNKTALIMGSEGNGIQKLLIKKSDFKVSLPMYGQIDSLNVSQATAVLLAYWRDQLTA